MKLGNGTIPALDKIDSEILGLLQRDCKVSLASIGERVGLSAPSVVERIRKLEQAGVIRGYQAILDSKELGLDVTAFIGVALGQVEGIGDLEDLVSALEGILECHHVTGQHTLLLKAKTANTASLENLISQIRTLPGVVRTETMVVLSTAIESSRIPLPGRSDSTTEPLPRRRAKGSGPKSVAAVS